MKKLTTEELEDLLQRAGAHEADNLWDVSLGQYDECFKIDRAFQMCVNKDDRDLKKRLAESDLPEIQEGKKVTVVLEMTLGFPMAHLQAIHTWATAILGDSKLERFIPVYLYESDFASRITVIYHDAKRRRAFCSRIKSQSAILSDLDFRIGEKLEAEMERNKQVETIIALNPDDLQIMLSRTHLLWTDVASSTRAASEIVKKFRHGMVCTKRTFDIDGLILFIEVDRDFTTLGEVTFLKNSLQKIAGVEVAMNVRVRDSLIKTINCRGILAGSAKYVAGQIYSDFGIHEILLYLSPNKDCGHLTLALFSEGKLTISRYNWGDDRTSNGKSVDYYHLDTDNTTKLFKALHVKQPEALLRTIRRRFASRVPSFAENHFLRFCEKNGIQYIPDPN